MVCIWGLKRHRTRHSTYLFDCQVQRSRDEFQDEPISKAAIVKIGIIF